MARGITENDVHTAADELVAAGERPTVDRIRAHLGTGSPNTVTRWLETWWQRLGDRLQGQRRRLEMPDAPEAVIALASEWWARALEGAKETLAASLERERLALDLQRNELKQARVELEEEATALREQAVAAIQAESVASTRSVELQRLIDRLESQVVELAGQRDAASAREREAFSSRQLLECRIQELQDAAQAERMSLAAHVQAIENRAHAEVDRARQELKELQGRVTSAAKERTDAETALQRSLEQAKRAAADSSQSAHMERARADALETQLAKLQDLPAALEAALRRSEPALKARKPSRTKGAHAKRQ